MVDINIVSLFVAGVLSFFSPCVVGLIPLYFSYITGVGASDLKKGHQKHRLILKTLVLILGFSLFFSLLGAAASVLGNFFFAKKVLINSVMGILMILFGLFTMDILKPKLLSRQIDFSVKINDSLLTAFLLGIAFAFAIGPCAGPLLGAALTLAASTSTVAQGMGYLFIYSFGLGVPLLITALFMEKALVLLKNNITSI